MYNGWFPRTKCRGRSGRNTHRYGVAKGCDLLTLAAPGSVAMATPSLPLSLPRIPLFTSSSTAGRSLPIVATATNTAGTSATTSATSISPLPAPKKQPTPPFKVANSIVPIPGRLVSRIQALEYVDMRELLPDNLALAERLATLPQGLAPPKPPGEREIAGDKALLTWVSSFTTYVAIVAEAHPSRVGDMLAYMRLLVREASKFAGNGWLTYDAVFRRNQVGLSNPWNYIDASLHQVYVANQQGRVSTPCKHCLEVDHTSADCAVAAVLPRPREDAADSPSPARMVERPPTKGKRPAPYGRQRPICTSWNGGNCKFPGKCTYAHVCSNCYGVHPATACKERPYTGAPMAARMPPRPPGSQ